jgi:hypothetical protein
MEYGSKYFVQTATHYYSGVVSLIKDGFLHMGSAAWIADTGRFAQAIEDLEKNAKEVEPCGSVLIPLTSIVAAIPVTTIPTSQR